MFLILMPLSSIAGGHIALGLQTSLMTDYISIYKKNMSCTNSYIMVKESVAKVINLLINFGGVTSTNTMHQVSFLFWCYLIVSLCTSFLGLYCPGTHGSSMGNPLVFPVEQLHLDQISFGPLTPTQKSTIESTLVVSIPMPRIIWVWQTCDGLSRVLFTLYLLWKLYAGMTRCTGRCTGQTTSLRYQEGCHFAMQQNSGVVMGVSSSFFWNFILVEQVHHC